MEKQINKKLNLKFQSLTKTKRIRDVPENFEALKKIVEALVKDEQMNPDQLVIRYADRDDELINVSDDEDLLAAYEVAELDLDGSLKFVVQEKKPVIQIEGKLKKKNKSKEKKEKKVKKDKK